MPQANPHPFDPGPPIPSWTICCWETSATPVSMRASCGLCLARHGAVSKWLRGRGVEAEEIEEAFPGSGWDD